MKKREALKAWAEGHLLLVHNSNGDYEDDYFYMDDEFTIIPFHEYILKLNRV